MLRLVKWLLGLLFTLILLLVVTAVVLPFVIDPNDYKAQITDLVKEQTGRDLRIQQDLKLSVFPWLGVETGQVVLGNAPDFGEQPFARIEQLGLKVKLLPLLKKQIEVDTLILGGLQLNLMKNKAGVTNWADLQKSQPAQDKTPTEPAAGASADIAFSVQGVQIHGAQISWRDQQTGQVYHVNDFDLTTGGLYPGAESPVQTGFRINSEQPPLESTFKIKTQLKIGQNMQHFGLRDLAVDLEAKGPLLPQSGMQLALSTQAVLDLAQDVLTLDELSISGPQMRLSGDVAVRQLQKSPDTQANIALHETNLKQLAALFGVMIETRNEAALTRFSADTRVRQQGGEIKLDPFNAVLDESRLNGHLHLLDMHGPVVRTALQVDQINLDHYLPPVAPETADKSPQPASQASPGNPFGPLRTLDLQAEARIGKLVANQLHLQDIVIKAVNKQGVLQLKPFNAKLYQGEFNGAITLNTQGKQPRTHAVKKLTGVQIGDLLTDLMGEDRLLGNANVELDVRTVGFSEPEIRSSLNGGASFRVLNGAYKGVNIAQLIRETGAALGLRMTQGSSEAKQTDFSELGGSVKIKNGLITNQDLSAKSPLLRIDGKGQVNLVENTVDYLLVTELVQSLEGQGGKGRNDLTGLPIPVKITGPLQNPSYRPELGELISKKAEQRIKQEVKKETEKVKQKIEQKIQQEAAKKLGEDVINDEGVKDVLKGLFGQ